MYFRKIESIPGEKQKHDDALKAGAASRLKTVAAKLKKRRQDIKEGKV